MAKKLEQIFPDEYRILEEAEELIRDNNYTEKQLKSKYETLLKSYKRFLRNQSKITNINDTMHGKVRELSIQLESYNDKLNRELDNAAKYVVSLLPEKMNDSNFSIDWEFFPSEKLGGDIFNYFMLDDDNLAFFLIDVSGHGVGSALHSVTALNVIRNQNLPGCDFREPAQVFQGLNRSFQMSEYGGVYFTIWYGVYNTKTRLLKHAGSGHPAGILVKDGRSEEVLCPNLMIGAVPEYPFESAEITIETGSKLYIFSDGVYEIRLNHEDVWSFDEFKDYLTSISDDSDVFEKLYNKIMEIGLSEELEDDFSIYSIDFK